MIWASFVLAICGWGGSLWSWADHGHAAGVDPGFIFALSVGITFTITACQSIVMPDKARLYAAGHRDGYAAATAHGSGGTPERARVPLAMVR